MLLLLIAAAAGAQEASDGAFEALRICRAAGALSSHEHAVQLERGLALAQRAVSANPDDPVAHFAAFCNRGRRVQMDGLRPQVLGEVRRARRDIDRALALAPDWPEALAAKGALLLALPRLLGGDRDEGLRLLERAVALDPSNPEARVILRQADTAHVVPNGVSDRPADGIER